MLPLSQFSLHTFLNSKTIRFHSAGVTSIGTRSLSCKLTPHAPALPRRAGILIPPEAPEAHKISEWITPAIATVHRPENLCSGGHRNRPRLAPFLSRTT